MQDVRYELIALWIQTAVYFMTALFIYERLYRSEKMPGVEFVMAMRTRMRRDIRVAARDIKEARQELKEKLEQRKKN